MGFNKRHIDKERIISAFKQHGAQGIVDFTKASSQNRGLLARREDSEEN